MRIIENPNPLDEEIVVCSECKCKYAYNKNDVHIRSGNNGVLGPGFMGWCDRWVNCPNCGAKYTIKEKQNGPVEELRTLPKEKSGLTREDIDTIALEYVKRLNPTLSKFITKESLRASYYLRGEYDTYRQGLIDMLRILKKG